MFVRTQELLLRANHPTQRRYCLLFLEGVKANNHQPRWQYKNFDLGERPL